MEVFEISAILTALWGLQSRLPTQKVVIPVFPSSTLTSFSSFLSGWKEFPPCSPPQSDLNIRSYKWPSLLCQNAIIEVEMWDKNILARTTVYQWLTFAFHFLVCETLKVTIRYIVHLPQYWEYSNYVWIKIQLSQANKNKRQQRMKTWIILQTHSSLSIVVLFCIVEQQYKTVGIEPLSAEPSLSEHLSHKILTSGSGASRGYPQPTEGFRASP